MQNNVIVLVAVLVLVPMDVEAVEGIAAKEG
jgi:hypothetical protein